MAAAPALSSGALRAILSDQKLDFFPILQVLQFKKHCPEGGAVRYRILISDGVNYQLVVSSTALTTQIEADLKKLCIIELTGFNISTTKNKRILIISGFHIVHGPAIKIGDPKNLEENAGEEGMDGPEAKPQAQQSAASPPSSSLAPAPAPALQRPPPAAVAAPIRAPAPVRPTPPGAKPPVFQQQQQRQQQQQPPPQARPLPPTTRPSQGNPQQQQQQRPSFNLPNQAGAPVRPQRPPFQPQQQGQGNQVQRGPPGAARPNARPPVFQQQQQQQQQQEPGMGFGGAPVSTFPIANLNPFQPRWVIKARITAKSAIKEWSNARGEGKLFNIDLIDQSGEIRAVGFNDAVDRFYDHLHVGGVYYISRASIRSPNKSYSSIKNNYELQIEPNTMIHPCETDAPDIPTANFSFVPLSHLENLEKDVSIDVIALVLDGSDFSIRNTKNGDTAMRKLVLVDSSGVSIKCSIWGKNAEAFEWEDHPIYGFKSLRVTEFGGRSLSASSNSSFMKNPDIREAHELRAWFEGVGGSAFNPRSLTVEGGTSLSNVPKKTVEQIREEGLAQQEGQVDEFLFKAYVLNIPKDGNIAYPACPTEKCNKKVTEYGDQQWQCEKCHGTFSHCNYRYTLSLSLADFTGQIWMRSFDNVGSVLIGQPADRAVEMRKMAQSNDMNQPTEYEALMQGALFKQYTFKVKGKLDKYEDTVKPSFLAQAAWPVEYLKDSRRLLQAIAEFS